MIASLRCWTSERISAVDRIATAIITAIGMISSGGVCTTALAFTPNVTASISARVTATPVATPRAEKRELSVTIGMANHAITGDLGPPVIAAIAAIIVSDPVQAANSMYSG